MENRFNRVNLQETPVEEPQKEVPVCKHGHETVDHWQGRQYCPTCNQLTS